MIADTTRTRWMDSTEGAITRRWNIVSFHQFHHYSRCNIRSSTVVTSL